MNRSIACLVVVFAFVARIAVAQPIETSASVAYIVDFQTGAVMLDKNSDPVSRAGFIIPRRDSRIS